MRDVLKRTGIAEKAHNRKTMADQKDDKKANDKKKEKPRSGNSGGNMGAGRSGKEGMGSEKPGDGPGVGSQKPGQPRT
jgi:hypothetical protein